MRSVGCDGVLVWASSRNGCCATRGRRSSTRSHCECDRHGVFSTYATFEYREHPVGGPQVAEGTGGHIRQGNLWVSTQRWSGKSSHMKEHCATKEHGGFVDLSTSFRSAVERQGRATSL